MIADVDQVLTPEEMVVFRRVTAKGIALAKSLNRQDKVEFFEALLKQTEEESCLVYPTK
jgi:hypothetical protein